MPIEPLYPFGPVSVHGTTVKLTHDKIVDLGGLFPRQIRVNARPLLSAPIKLRIQTARSAFVVKDLVNSANDYFTMNSPHERGHGRGEHGFQTGDRVQLTATNNPPLPAELELGNWYYVRQVPSDELHRFRLHENYADAINNSAAISFSSPNPAATGQLIFTRYREVEEVAGEGSWTLVDPGRVEGTWKWQGADVELAAQRRIDDDGFMLFNLAFKPIDGAYIRFNKVELEIPLADGLTQYALAFPSNDHLHAREFMDGVWSQSWNSTDGSFLFPRSVICHDGEYGLQWAMESDRHFAGFGGSPGTSRIEVDQHASCLTVCPVDGLAPSQNRNVTVEYEFILFPLPAKKIVPRPARLGMPSDLNFGASDFYPVTAERPQSYRWQGSGLPRSEYGPEEDAQPKDWDWWKKHEVTVAKGIGIVPYMIANCWPEHDSVLPWTPDHEMTGVSSEDATAFFSQEYYLENGFGARYDIVPVNLSNAEGRAKIIARYKSLIEDLECDGIYFDVAQPTVQQSSLDRWGASRYRRDFKLLREMLRDMYAYYQAAGKKVLMHPQNEFMPCVHAASCDIWIPGEDMGPRIESVPVPSNRAERLRFYSANVTDYQKGAEWAPKAFGAQCVVLPKLFYSANDELSVDENDANSDYGMRLEGTPENFATQVYVAETLLRGAGQWNSFSQYSVMAAVFNWLHAAGVSNAIEFRPFDHPRPFAASSNADARISGWRTHDSLILVVVNRSETSQDIPIHTTLPVTYVDSSANRLVADAVSRAESRSTPYAGTIAPAGHGCDFDVGVALRCFTLVRFLLPFTRHDYRRRRV